VKKIEKAQKRLGNKIENVRTRILEIERTIGPLQSLEGHSQEGASRKLGALNRKKKRLLRMVSNEDAIWHVKLGSC
jgi:hypothetical protein